MEIRKIMEKETAIKLIDEMKDKICGVDLDKICGDEVSAKGDETDEIYKSLIQAVMCGLVYWDDEKNCLAQNLISELKSGEISRTTLYYSHEITLGDTRDFKSNNQFDHVIKSIGLITACPVHLIEKLKGKDLNIAMGCVGFFGK